MLLTTDGTVRWIVETNVCYGRGSWREGSPWHLYRPSRAGTSESSGSWAGGRAPRGPMGEMGEMGAPFGSTRAREGAWQQGIWHCGAGLGVLSKAQGQKGNQRGCSQAGAWRTPPRPLSLCLCWSSDRLCSSALLEMRDKRQETRRHDTDTTRLRRQPASAASQCSSQQPSPALYACAHPKRRRAGHAPSHTNGGVRKF